MTISKAATVPPIDRSCGIYDLADACGVDIGLACDQAAIARSTPSRWRSGTKPRASRVVLLRQAILEIAAKQGTLPAEHSAAAGGGAGAMRAAIARIRRDLDMLERAVGSA